MTATLQVALMGSKPVTVGLDDDTPTVADAIKQAAQTLGVTINTDNVGMIKNGQQVQGDAPVTDGDTVTAATRVANG